MREKEKQEGARGAGSEVKAVVAVVTLVRLLLLGSGGKRRRTWQDAWLWHCIQTGGEHKAYLFDSPILLPQGEWKKLHETAIRYSPVLASSGQPSIL